MGRLTESEAIDMLQAKLTCIERETKPIYSEEGCDRDCDGCEYCYAQGTVGEQKESLNMAIKALEKQIAKKPIEKTDSCAYFCPCCNEYIRSIYTRKEIILEEHIFCGRCGQKFDWK